MPTQSKARKITDAQRLHVGGTIQSGNIEFSRRKSLSINVLMTKLGCSSVPRLVRNISLSISVIGVGITNTANNAPLAAIRHFNQADSAVANNANKIIHVQLITKIARATYRFSQSQLPPSKKYKRDGHRKVTVSSLLMRYFLAGFLSSAAGLG